MKRRVKAALILFFVLFLSACDIEGEGDFISSMPLPEGGDVSPAPSIVVPSGPARQGIFGVAFESSASLSPFSGESRLNGALLPLLYEGLFSVDEQFLASPLLCERFTRNGGEYTFYLREDVTFSNGSPLTALDVRYSLLQARAAGSPYASRLACVGAVEAVSDTVVRVTLTENKGRFEALLDLPVVRQNTASEPLPVGTGPYVYDSDENSQFLTARSDYWRNVKMPLDRIELIDTPEASMLIYSFETGAVSLVGDDPLATDPVGFGGDYEVWEFPSRDLYFLGFNAQRAPFSEARMRRAISFAIDREVILSEVLQRHGDAAPLPVNPASPLFDAALSAEASYSIQKFSELLDASGVTDHNGDGFLDYPSGRTYKAFQIDFIVPAENRFKAEAANLIAETLRASGIDVSLRELKWGNYLAALKSGDFDLYFGEVILTGDFDVSLLVGSSGALNYGGYGNAELDALHASFLAVSAGNTAARRARDFYALFLEETPIAPVLFKRLSAIGRRGAISGMAPVEGNIFHEMERWTVRR